MTDRVHWRPLVAAAALLAAWVGGQFWLARRTIDTVNAQGMAAYRRVLAITTARGLPAPHLPPHLEASVWVRAGAESAVAALLIVALAAAMIAGGRRWWAAVVVAFPLANVLGGFNDGATLGLGWAQQTVSGRSWFIAGTFVDSLLLLVLVALLIRALPTPPTATPATWAVARALPVAAVLILWWVVQDNEGDPASRVWIGQAIGFVFIAALLAAASLPRPVKVVAVLGVLPLATFAILDGLIGEATIHFDTTTYLHHAAVAAVTVVYVVAVPVLLKRLRPIKPKALTA